MSVLCLVFGTFNINTTKNIELLMLVSQRDTAITVTVITYPLSAGANTSGLGLAIAIESAKRDGNN